MNQHEYISFPSALVYLVSHSLGWHVNIGPYSTECHFPSVTMWLRLNAPVLLKMLFEPPPPPCTLTLSVLVTHEPMITLFAHTFEIARVHVSIFYKRKALTPSFCFDGATIAEMVEVPGCHINIFTRRIFVLKTVSVLNVNEGLSSTGI